VTVVWSPRATAHLAHLRAYIARENPAAAGRVAMALLAAVERLAELPNLGRPGRVFGTRELVVPGTPYVIPYRLRGGRLEIIAVFHGRQRWPQRLE
jgi:toxin ParE1/3/4